MILEHIMNISGAPSGVMSNIRSYPTDFIPPPDGLHEVYAATQADATCLSGYVLMLARTIGAGVCLWVRHAGQNRETGEPSPAGLAELGIDPARIVLLIAHDPTCALQASLEGARTPHLAAVIMELWGAVKAYDLTASRRLALAAKASGTRVLVARAAASPTPSAAETRWQVRAVPSSALAANAPGHPAFELTLLRARNGQEGLRYCVEWDRNARKLASRFLPCIDDALPRPAPLSGAVVPVSFDRPGKSPDEPRRQAG